MLFVIQLFDNGIVSSPRLECRCGHSVNIRDKAKDCPYLCQSGSGPERWCCEGTLQRSYYRMSVYRTGLSTKHPPQHDTSTTLSDKSTSTYRPTSTDPTEVSVTFTTDSATNPSTQQGTRGMTDSTGRQETLSGDKWGAGPTTGK